MSRATWLLLSTAVALAACGDAVTNPSLEGFDHDPTPVAGDWVTAFTTPRGETTLYQAELVPAGGTFLGRFEFNRFGDIQVLQFSEATWDGVRVSFTAPFRVAGMIRDVAWLATWFPPSGGEPARLLLSSDATGGPASPITYVRPADAP